MKFLYWLTLPAMIFILYSCSPSSTVLMKDYEDQNLTGKSLSIVKVFDRPIISNYDDVTDDLGAGVPEAVYMKYFKQKFTATLQQYAFINNVVFVDSISKSYLNEKLLNISNGVQIRAYLPNENIKLKNINSNFILFLYNLNISRLAGSTGTFMNGSMVGGSFEKLFHQLDFAIWDNDKGKVVSYGRIEANSSVLFAMTESNWESDINHLALKIVQESPFKAKY